MNGSNTHSEDHLATLLDHPGLWRAGQLPRPADTSSSGFSALDEHLPGGGWPRGGLAEFLLSTAGVGELRLLVPLMRALSRDETRWVAWINPPFLPYAPALEALGVDIRKILLIHPKTHREALWALERASRSGTCSLALAWLDERQLKLKDTRRLQIAARQGRTFTCLFRPEEAAAVNSMAELRLQMAASDPGSVVVDIRKRRGGWPVTGIRLQIDDETNPAEIREQLSLWRSKWRHRMPDMPAAMSAARLDDLDVHDGRGHGARQHREGEELRSAVQQRITH
jgi:cell division inhibitor SulA